MEVQAGQPPLGDDALRLLQNLTVQTPAAVPAVEPVHDHRLEAKSAQRQFEEDVDDILLAVHTERILRDYAKARTQEEAESRMIGRSRVPQEPPAPDAALVAANSSALSSNQKVTRRRQAGQQNQGMNRRPQPKLPARPRASEGSPKNRAPAKSKKTDRIDPTRIPVMNKIVMPESLDRPGAITID